MPGVGSKLYLFRAAMPDPRLSLLCADLGEGGLTEGAGGGGLHSGGSDVDI